MPITLGISTFSSFGYISRRELLDLMDISVFYWIRNSLGRPCGEGCAKQGRVSTKARK